MTIRRAHYLSGLILSMFIGLHLCNHLVSILGAEMHIVFMQKLRLVYRQPIVEVLLLIAVSVQVFSGLKLFFRRRKLQKSRYATLHIWTGLYLAFFFIIHVGAVLTGRYVLHLDTNFYFGVAGLNIFPLNLFFIPYYGLAILSFFGHVSAIHHQKMNKPIFGLSIQQQSKMILMLGMLVMMFILFGLTNGFAGVEIPKEYKTVFIQ